MAKRSARWDVVARWVRLKIKLYVVKAIKFTFTSLSMLDIKVIHHVGKTREREGKEGEIRARIQQNVAGL